jgi:hypothetical protein
MSDQPVAEVATYTIRKETNVHALSGIRTRDSDKEACTRTSVLDYTVTGIGVDSFIDYDTSVILDLYEIFKTLRVFEVLR